jgi:uncharacterized protein YmfQ (DUF2313 family)
VTNTIAGLGAADFLSGGQGLLPPGDALPRDVEALLTTLLSGLTGRMVDVHAQASLLSEIESDPRETTLLLPDWEASFGLPDPCLGASPSYAQRRQQLVSRIAARGGQSPDYMISVAATLGYPITITQFRPFTFGQPFGSLMYGQPWAYVWQVNAPTFTVDFFEFGQNNFGDSFSSFGNTALQCELQRICPAHTQLLFSFSQG